MILQVTASSAPQPQVSLLQPVPVDASASKPLLVYFSGTDGTGNAIAPQLPGLIAAGFDVRCLYIAMTNRSSWEQLLAEVLPLLRTLVADRPANQRRVTLVGESFGGCLALRLAIAAPQLLERMVLVNPATCFAKSYGGLSSFIAGTNLLSLFPETLYQAAQAVMIPLLLDPEKVGRNTVGAIKSMMIMTPPPNFKAGQGFVAADEGRRQLGGPQGLQLYLPAATASWRLRLLREGDVPDHQLATIRTPTLILASAEDRLLPSRAESARLQRVIPDARRLLLPSSGHTALLEEAVNLADIMKRTGFLPEDQPAPAPVSQGSAELLRSGAAEPESYLGSWDAIDEAYEAGAGTLELFRNIISPAMSGVEHLPDPLSTKRPILFVGNHTLYGVYDLPFLMYELYIRGFKARGLAHPSHWQGPVGEFFERYGAVKASPMAAYRLLKEKQAVLLFPGGGREVNKRKGEAYQLQWRDSPDFVRLAAKLKAIIVPFAALGADDAFDLALDTDEILGSPLLGPLARALLARVDPALDPAETVFPISKLPYTGLPSLVPIPKPERLYFRFLPAIDTTQALQNVGDAEQCMRVYGGVKARVLAGIAELKAEREADPERHLPRRLLAQAKRMMPAFDLMKDVIH
ncbi:hypothetical protein WJX72_003968 [[Myrmecia] bisecta]|uniref:Phospholipid/glycerol acyltransferase domain-containing protein n=1 Tax=[Myrmecia] bisecta TaxID=41462 RepID=A0AAW1QQ09_9CHLO